MLVTSSLRFASVPWCLNVPSKGDSENENDIAGLYPYSPETASGTFRNGGAPWVHTLAYVTGSARILVPVSDGLSM